MLRAADGILIGRMPCLLTLILDDSNTRNALWTGYSFQAFQDQSTIVLCLRFDHYSSSEPSPRVSLSQDLRTQMSRIAFAETPYSAESSPAVRDVLVFLALKMSTAWYEVKRTRSG
mmetsp:Transcript_60316/g.88342  ORF Transcript_60316/g.88342 Transcript_60316/m.88342 type:complete len:116 (+) Transcript_60316:588-935(+)